MPLCIDYATMPRHVASRTDQANEMAGGEMPLPLPMVQNARETRERRVTLLLFLSYLLSAVLVCFHCFVISLRLLAFYLNVLFTLLCVSFVQWQARDDREDELQHVLPSRRSLRRCVRAGRREAAPGRRGARGSGRGAAG